MNQTKKCKQTLESVQYGLNISFNKAFTKRTIISESSLLLEWTPCFKYQNIFQLGKIQVHTFCQVAIQLPTNRLQDMGFYWQSMNPHIQENSCSGKSSEKKKLIIHTRSPSSMPAHKISLRENKLCTHAPQRIWTRHLICATNDSLWLSHTDVTGSSRWRASITQRLCNLKPLDLRAPCIKPTPVCGVI